MKKRSIIVVIILIIIVITFMFFIHHLDMAEIGISTDSKALEIGDSFHVPGDAGQLEVTITDAKVTTSISEQGVRNGFFLSDAYITINNEPDNTVYQYPDFIKSDGSFVEGVYLIVLDLLVENIDAKTELYEDPYIFRADSIVTLINLKEKDGANFKYNNPDWFSLIESLPQHSSAFRLEPGETANLSIGFLVDAQWGKDELALLRASTGASIKCTQINLNLGEPSHEK